MITLSLRIKNTRRKRNVKMRPTDYILRCVRIKTWPCSSVSCDLNKLQPVLVCYQLLSLLTFNILHSPDEASGVNCCSVQR